MRQLRSVVGGSPMGIPMSAVRAKPRVQLVGRSPAMAALRQEIERVARSDAKVLITGESGVGKEIVAGSIRALGPRARKPFVPVNCAGLTETLLESEIFGHVRGSFTGAHRDKAGTLEMAHTGTVFLDEVGEMTMRMQGLLLRFLETGEIQKVGSDGLSQRLDVRVIAATNRDVRAMVAQRTFREDLFYRLNVIEIVVPPLRERREDIPLLVEEFLGQFLARNRSSITGVSPQAMQVLTAHRWPGNVRELENVMERLVVTVPGPTIDVDHLSLESRVQGDRAVGPDTERRRTVADELYGRLIDRHESFWSAVYPLFMEREITRSDVREVVRRGLKDARGSYKIVAKIFNIERKDYKRFLNFIAAHECKVPYQEYR